MWFGQRLTMSCKLVESLNTATVLKYIPGGGGEFVLNLIGQKLARLTYSFLHTSEYVQVANLEADSVRGPKEIWKLQFPGYSVVLGIVGRAWIGIYDDVRPGTGVDGPEVEVSR